jgi:hypothetical protein
MFLFFHAFFPSLRRVGSVFLIKGKRSSLEEKHIDELEGFWKGILISNSQDSHGNGKSSPIILWVGKTSL